MGVKDYSDRCKGLFEQVKETIRTSVKDYRVKWDFTPSKVQV